MHIPVVRTVNSKLLAHFHVHHLVKNVVSGLIQFCTNLLHSHIHKEEKKDFWRNPNLLQSTYTHTLTHTHKQQQQQHIK